MNDRILSEPLEVESLWPRGMSGLKAASQLIPSSLRWRPTAPEASLRDRDWRPPVMPDERQLGGARRPLVAGVVALYS